MKYITDLFGVLLSLFPLLSCFFVSAKEYKLAKVDVNTAFLYILCSGPHNNVYFTGGSLEVNYDIQCQYSSQFVSTLCRAKPSNLVVSDIQYALNDQTLNATFVSQNSTLTTIEYPLNSDIGNYQHVIPITTQNNETVGILYQCAYDNSKQTLDCTAGLSHILCKNPK